MGKANYQFRDTQIVKKRHLHPIWRGIGFIILVLLAVGGFWLAGYLLELNWQQAFLPFHLPRDFTITVHPALPKLPGKLMVQLGTVVILDIVGYGLLVFLYGLVNPVRLGPTDAPPVRGGRRPRSMAR